MATPLPVIRTEFTLAEVCEQLGVSCTATHRCGCTACAPTRVRSHRDVVHRIVVSASMRITTLRRHERGASALLVRRGAMPAGAQASRSTTPSVRWRSRALPPRRCRPNGCASRRSVVRRQDHHQGAHRAAFGAAFGTTLATPGTSTTSSHAADLADAHGSAPCRRDRVRQQRARGDCAPGVQSCRPMWRWSPTPMLHTPRTRFDRGRRARRRSLFGFASVRWWATPTSLCPRRRSRAGDGVVRRYFGLAPRLTPWCASACWARWTPRIRVRIVEELCPGAGVVEVITRRRAMVSANVRPPSR